MNIAVPDIGTLFPIPSKTSAHDKRFLLQTIALAKRTLGSFSYVEIGSYLGGSSPRFCSTPPAKPSCQSMNAAGNSRTSAAPNTTIPELRTRP